MSISIRTLWYDGTAVKSGPGDAIIYQSERVNEF